MPRYIEIEKEGRGLTVSIDGFIRWLKKSKYQKEIRIRVRDMLEEDYKAMSTSNWTYELQKELGIE